jgi:hypothetical protein
VAAIPASSVRGSRAGSSVNQQGSAERGRSPPVWPVAVASVRLDRQLPCPELRDRRSRTCHHGSLRVGGPTASPPEAVRGARASPWPVAELDVRRRGWPRSSAASPCALLAARERRREVPAGSGRWRLPRQGGGQDRCKWPGGKTVISIRGSHSSK